MGATNFRPLIGKFRVRLLMAGAAVIAAAVLVASNAGRPPSPAPVAQGVEAPVEAHADLHLASLQQAFAMSHLGVLREDPEAEPARRETSGSKPRAAAPRPAQPTRPAAPAVIATPLPAPSAPTPPEQASPEGKHSRLFFGFAPTLPSPGKWVDRVAELGDSITSLVRWRYPRSAVFPERSTCPM